MTRIVLHSRVDLLNPHLSEPIFEHLKRGQVERFESLDDACLISFDWYDIFDHTLSPSQLIIYFSSEQLFFVCETQALFDKVTGLVREQPENEKTLATFFSELMKPDMDYLESVEDEIAEMENNLLINSKTECAHAIVRFRKRLIRLKKYYEQLNTIFENITENENELITHANLKYFIVLDNRVDRLFSTVLNLRDFVTQVREAYQAQIDIEQNAIMKIFTVITSIFLPLTLIVGWYGMNLQMPEFSWRLGYLFVILLSVCVCLLCIALFKRKKWF